MRYNTITLLLSGLALLGPAVVTLPAAAQELSGYTNVKSFGAVGDGNADDTVAIGNALAAIRNGGKGGVLYFPTGTYNTSGNYDVTHFNAKGDGIRMRGAAAPGNAAVAVTGVIVTSNQGDGISVETPLNALGPVISGVDETGSGGVGLRTGSTTNRIVVVGNRFERGTALGIGAQVFANNGQ